MAATRAGISPPPAIACASLPTSASSPAELAFVHRWLDSWAGIGDFLVGMAPCRLGSPAHRVRRWSLAGDGLRNRHGAFDRGRLGVRGDGVAGGAAGGVDRDLQASVVA